MAPELEFPKHIDDPPTLLIWRLDDLTPLLIGLIIGILSGQLLLSLAIGAALVHGYRKYRDRMPDGYAIHLLWSWGLIPLRGRQVPNPYARAFGP
ncbi:MAG: type IV conjugative transfer system protein TraL [Chromatiaceae bacterium]|nr:MAG: type IV conjugative transfer system protein TraL [Chromatiaceae bacterium]